MRSRSDASGKQMKLLGRDTISLDFEFNDVNEKQVNLVCCTTTHSNGDLQEWWLHSDPSAQKNLAKYLKDNSKAIVVGYALIAEFRSYMALGLNPVEFDGVDLFIEYRMLTNHNDTLLYGEQLVNGKIKNTVKPPPKWERTEEDSKSSFKPTHSLAEATFKLLGEVRDTEHKNEMRDIIISRDKKLIEKNKGPIQDYCTEDVVHLPSMLQEVINQYESLGIALDDKLLSQMLLRGKYSALTAKMESRGYPIDFQKTKNFSSSVGPIIEECQREINDLFPEISPFIYNRKERRFSWNQKSTKAWLKENADVDRWMKTDGFKTAKRNAIKSAAEELAKTTKRKMTQAEKQKAIDTVEPSDYLSLSLEAWSAQYSYRHDYPKDSFPAQMVRYLKLKQNLNGFVPNAKGSFWDAVGSDTRVRPYFNIYGSLSSRSQPGSRSFLFLKPAWMRALCVPPKGRAIATIDYGSQEYLISALISDCQEMIDAYDSGDVYVAFAKASGLIPPDGSKETHNAERQLAKACVLGMSYLMTSIGLSAKLTTDLGYEVTEDDAQEYIDLFYEAYSDLSKWQEDVQKEYSRERSLILPCGWMLFGDNDNFRSVVNFNIQGLGASILRKAVEFCDLENLDVVVTLHDALYIEYDHDDLDALDRFRDCMFRAFIYYFPNQIEDASKIRMDIQAWGPNYPEEGELITPKGLKVPVSTIYVDDRAVREYNQFKKYFEKREENEL